MQSFAKRPGEKYPIAVDFRDRLPPGQSITAVTASAINSATGVTASSTVLSSTTGTIDDTKAKVTVQAGTHGINYQLTVTVGLTDGGSLEETLQMVVDSES